MSVGQINEVPLIRLSAFTCILDDIDNDVIARQMYSQAIPIERETPDYGWISRGFVQFDDLVVPVSDEISALEEKIKTVIHRISGKECVIDDIWGVVLEKHQSVLAHSHRSNLHSHPEEHYSFAYYPDCPVGSAELIFMVGYCDTMQHAVPIKPQPGLLVVFNSFISHMTARHALEATRLVISGNTSPVSPNAEPNADWTVYHDRHRAN